MGPHIGESFGIDLDAPDLNRKIGDTNPRLIEGVLSLLQAMETET